MLKERIRDHSSFPKVQETDFPGGSDSKESACNAGNWVQYLGQENPQEEEMVTLPAFLPGEFHGQRSLVGCSLWGRKESATERLSTQHIHQSMLSLIFTLLTL